MRPGYSKLLINENVIPDTGADWQVTGLDLMLMDIVASGERKEAAWRELSGEAGLKMVRIWNCVNAVGSLIECELLEN
ncbi:hypothetical protein AJ80_01996 [Polytolypa hystricis UAMH7299]|uniref:O-methyltransferase domain-containing protein n=1 Tax=Polytolypa hystricis (strain UAMH7299) TaxID=1447883 RepID=A0A2B7YIM4_POLH7|nr:hypothetical protein AJ80_01996 [Polytolypa hystricis UAMH7299]